MHIGIESILPLTYTLLSKMRSLSKGHSMNGIPHHDKIEVRKTDMDMGFEEKRILQEEEVILKELREILDRHSSHTNKY